MPAFESNKFEKLLSDVVPLQCLDIGARGESYSDLKSIGHAIDLLGFEPDKEECERLNEQADPKSSHYKSVRFLPVAIGNASSSQALYIAKHRGASSFLKPDRNMSGRFYAADDLFDIEKEVIVEVELLDDVCAKNNLSDVSFMKIDVEGYELDVFRTARNLLSTSLLGIRAEVAFFPVRVGQPSYSEIERFLKEYNFIPMDFLFLHHWRAKTRYPQRRFTERERRVYRRQIMHGDALFFRDPNSIDVSNDEGVRLLIREAALLYTYGFFDHATEILERTAVSSYIQSNLGFSADEVISEMAVFFKKKSQSGWLSRLIRSIGT